VGYAGPGGGRPTAGGGNIKRGNSDLDIALNNGDSQGLNSPVSQFPSRCYCKGDLRRTTARISQKYRGTSSTTRREGVSEIDGVGKRSWGPGTLGVQRIADPTFREGVRDLGYRGKGKELL